VENYALPKTEAARKELAQVHSCCR
jgi:hypothetical protein